MFIGRTKELKKLRDVIQSSQSTLAVVYGRRRIGKSSLISQAFNGKKVLVFEGLENRPKHEQIKSFLFKLRIDTGENKKLTANTWREAFYHLFRYLEKHPHHLVFDEFQWMANYRQDIVSDLKMIWDQYISKLTGTTLILCGSIASFMTTKVLKSNALYGRTSLTINLKAFRLSETKQFLINKGLDEIFEAQMLVGGVPKYLELLASAPSVSLAIDEFAFTENGYFVEEYDKIFTSHFGRNPDYRKILEILGKFPYGLFRKEIAQKAKINTGGGLSKLLFDLESAGFISSETPFDKGHRTTTIKYFLKDPYLRFYFAFIQPELDKIKAGTMNGTFVKIKNSGAYFSWLGRAFEYLCIDHAKKLADILGFSGIDYTYGPYFQPPTFNEKGVQADLVFDRSDNVITVCEMKFTNKAISKEIIPQVERKIECIQKKFPRKTFQRVLVISGQVTEELKNQLYFSRIINSEELI